MELFSELTLKFEKPDWTRNPEFGLTNTILQQGTDLLDIVKGDITKGAKQSKFGRGDVPCAEQIMRAAIYKELKGLDYRDLEYHQTDSRICALFIKIDELRPYSFQMYQKYISRISEENLKKWRSGIEAVISNLKRGFNLRRVNWNGFEHFKSKVLWSVIAYNIRVMTRHILADLK